MMTKTYFARVGNFTSAVIDCVEIDDKTTLQIITVVEL